VTSVRTMAALRISNRSTTSEFSNTRDENVSTSGRQSPPDSESMPEIGESPPSRGAALRLCLIVAGVASAAFIALGLTWLAAPELNPYRGDEMASLLSAWLGAGGVAIAALALGGGGVATLLGLSRPTHAHPAAVMIAAPLALAAGIGLALGSTMIVSVAGYLFGTLVAAGALIAIVVLVLRRPVAGIAAIGALVVVGLVLGGVGVAGADALDFVAMLTAELWARIGQVLVAALVLAGASTWAGVAVLGAGAASRGRRWEDWLARHRVALTVLAALGPVPYAIARASWLTPWPLFAPSADVLDAMPTARVTGLIIGAGAAAACILTLGLVLPWGRIFPRWIPRIGGAPVPVWFAAVPGFTAAVLLLISTGPMIALSLSGTTSPGEAVTLNLALPFWFWGPTLFLAVWAYVARRRLHAEQ